MMAVQLFIGGLVAAGFDKSGDYLLTISHSGRGVFSTNSWERIARKRELAYPSDGVGIGIGPIHGEEVPVVEMDYRSGLFNLLSTDCRFLLHCESDGITIEHRR
jgi:hypothetical protein